MFFLNFDYLNLTYFLTFLNFILKVEKLSNEISDCINKQDVKLLLKLLKSKRSPFKNVNETNVDWYMAQLTKEKETKLVSFSVTF